MMTKEDHNWFKCSDGEKIHLYRWLPEAPRAVLLIVHGMMEHAARYSEFADFIGEKGIAVYAPDHRGHGMNVPKSGVGHWSPEEGWGRILHDLDDIRRHIHETHPGLPVFLLGHSMGSLLARHHFARRISTGRMDYDGMILSGATAPTRAEARLGKRLTNSLSIFKTQDHRSRVMARLTYELYNGPFQPGRTPFDWLSSDEEQVDRYLEDPYCGQGPTLGFWKEFFSGVLDLYKSERELKVPAGFPVLFIFGEEDPVGRMGKDPLKVARKYSSGDINLVIKSYPGDRHEILNETDRKRVYQDIVEWTDPILTR